LGLHPAKPDERLLVALWAGDHAVTLRQHLKAQLLGRCDDRSDGPLPDLRVANHSSLAHFVLPHLELRLDQGDDIPVRLQERASGWKQLLEAYEGSIDDDEVDRFWEVDRFEMPCVRSLHHHDTLILPKLVVELAVADVDREHLGGASLQEAIGEAARGGAEVRDAAFGRIVAKGVECACQLDASARDEWVVGFANLDRRCRIERFAALFDPALPRIDLARQDQRLRPGAGRREPSLRE